MKELNLIEMSVQAAETFDKNKAFEYISMVISEDIRDQSKLQDNFSFYRTLCNWTLKKFNEHIALYQNSDLRNSEPLLHRLQSCLYIFEKNPKSDNSTKVSYQEIAFLSKFQIKFKEDKIHVRKEDKNLMREQKSKYDNIVYKTTSRPSSYAEKPALELLLKGKFSSMLNLLKEKGYTVEQIQENLKNIMFYYMSQYHFGLDYVGYVFDDLGINSKQAIYEYFQNSLRRDIRKRIKRFFKDKNISQLTDEYTAAFLKLNEILCPADNITIAVRRKTSAQPAFKAIMPLQTKKGDYNGFWESRKDLSGPIEHNIYEYRGQLSPCNFGTFEIDDSYPEDVTYIERYYSLTKLLNETAKEGDEPYKIEDFRRYERYITEMNSKISKDLGKIGRFKPKSYNKAKQKCIELLNKLFSKYFGREIDLASIYIKRVDFYKLNWYFQMKVTMIQTIDLETMLKIVMSKIDITLSDHIEALERLNENEQLKYLDFFIKLATDFLNIEMAIGLVKWVLENKRSLFDLYFSVNKEIAKTPDAFKRTFLLLKHDLANYLSENSIYLEDELSNLMAFISRLANNGQISTSKPLSELVCDKMSDYIKHLLDKNFLFAPLHLFKRMNFNLEEFLEKHKIFQPLQRALLQSSQGEKHMGEILQKLSFQANPKQKWETLICEMKYQVLMSNDGPRISTETDEFMVNLLSTVYQGFKPGNIVAELLARPIIPNIGEHLYDLALNHHRYLRPRDPKRPAVHYGPEIKQALTVHTILLGMPFTAFMYFRYNRSYSILSELDAERIPNDIRSIKEVISKPFKNEKDEGMKFFEVIREVYKLILKRPFDKKMISSLEAFLQLNELDPSFFVVDVIVYRRVFITIYEEQNPDIKKEDLINLQLASEKSASEFPNQLDILRKTIVPEDVYDLFLEIFCQNLMVMLNLPRAQTSGFGSTLIDALQYLEKATVICESRLKNNPKQIDSPWRLVSKFCMLHNIPSSLKLLNEISAKNDWVRLLLELDVQKCPIETARDFITKYFHQAILKTHLLISLDEVDPANDSPLEKDIDLKKYNHELEDRISEALLKETKEMPCKTNPDLIRLVLKVREVFKRHVDRLDMTKSNQAALQKFLAKCFIELAIFKRIEILCLFAVFLDSSLSDYACFNHLRIELEKEKILNKKPKKNETEDEAELEQTDADDESEILDDVKLIEKWCSVNISRLNQLIHIYYGDVALLAFLDGLAEAVKNNFRSMNKCFVKFAERYLSEAKLDLYNISSQEFIERVIDSLIKNRFVNQNQMGKMLESFYHNNLCKKYQNLYMNYCAIKKTKEHMILNKQLGNLLDSQDLIFHPFKIFYMMLDQEMFGEAKAFGAHYSLEKSYTLFIQANQMLTQVMARELDFKNHKQLFIELMTLLRGGDALVYQTSQYLKYLSTHLRLSLWDHIYLLNIAHDLIEKLVNARAYDPPLKKLKKSKNKIALKMDILLYSHFPEHIRTHLFIHKEMKRDLLIADLEHLTPIVNVSLSESITTLVRKAYLNGLTNFDFPFVKLLEQNYLDHLAGDLGFAFYRDIQSIIHKVKFRNANLKGLLGYFNFTDEVEKIKETHKTYNRLVPGEKFEEELQRSSSKYQDEYVDLDEFFEKYQATMETHIKEEVITLIKGCIYFSRLAFMLGKATNTENYEFCSLEEIYDSIHSISFKQLIALMFASEDTKLEGANLVNFIMRYAKLDYSYLVQEYFDFALEDFPIFEKRSFLERINKIKKYEDILRKVIRFTIFLPDGFRGKFGSIAINYARYNKLEPIKRALFLSLGFILLWEHPKQAKLHHLAVSQACEMIESILSEKIPVVRTPETSDMFDPICIALFLFNWNSILIKKITSILDIQKRPDIWMQIYKNLDLDWGSVLLQKSFRLGNLASLEHEIQDNPANVGFLMYFKAKDYLGKLVYHVNGNRNVDGISFMDNLKELNDHIGTMEASGKEYMKGHLLMITRQLVEAYRFVLMAKKETFNQKLLNITKEIFNIIDTC